ncbi:hypothetical protein D5086_010816 [Populus alba]|uniref:Uncharacterized protein n=1 Tax=Populus alba TaxID=43335 RepID=A0ACC4CBK5_POPAL
MAEERATDEVGHGGTSDVDVKEMLLTIAEEMLLELEVPALDLEERSPVRAEWLPSGYADVVDSCARRRQRKNEMGLGKVEDDGCMEDGMGEGHRGW